MKLLIALAGVACGLSVGLCTKGLRVRLVVMCTYLGCGFTSCPLVGSVREAASRCVSLTSIFFLSLSPFHSLWKQWKQISSGEDEQKSHQKPKTPSLFMNMNLMTTPGMNITATSSFTWKILKLFLHINYMD